MILGGPALYLLGESLFRWRMTGVTERQARGGRGVARPAVPLGGQVSALRAEHRRRRAAERPRGVGAAVGWPCRDSGAPQSGDLWRQDAHDTADIAPRSRLELLRFSTRVAPAHRTGSSLRSACLTVCGCAPASRGKQGRPPLLSLGERLASPVADLALALETRMSAARFAVVDALHRRTWAGREVATEPRSKPSACAIAWLQHPARAQRVRVASVWKRCRGGGHSCLQINCAAAAEQAVTRSRYRSEGDAPTTRTARASSVACKPLARLRLSR